MSSLILIGVDMEHVNAIFKKLEHDSQTGQRSVGGRGAEKLCNQKSEFSEGNENQECYHGNFDGQDCFRRIPQ